MEKKISLSKEVVRFAITGLVCAILDFLVCQLFIKIFGFASDSVKNIVGTTMGFIFGVIANYLLSTFWVFKGGKNQGQVKTPIFIIKFIILSAVGLGLSIGAMELSRIIIKAGWDINIVEPQFDAIITFTFWGNVEFWLYFLCFCIKTIIGLVWNYFTRKYILYKTDNKVIEEENNPDQDN